MANELSNLVNTGFNSSYPGQEKILSFILSRSSSRPPTPVAPLNVPTQQRGGNAHKGLLDSLAAGNQPWQKKIKEKEARDSVAKGLAELVAARNKSGEKFLGATQRLKILSKHMPLSIASQLSDKISAEQQRLNPKPKYRKVTRKNQDGSTTTGLETEQSLVNNPIVTPPTWKDQERARLQSGETTLGQYTPAQRSMLGFGEDKPEKGRVGRDSRTSAQKEVDRWNKDYPDDQKTIFDFKSKGGVNKGAQGWADMEPTKKADLLEKFINLGVSPSEGYLSAEDYYITNGVVSRPEGYRSPEEFSSEATNFLSQSGEAAGNRTPEEFAEIINAARKRYGPIDTLNKWREDFQRLTKAKKAKQPPQQSNGASAGFESAANTEKARKAGLLERLSNATGRR